MAIDVTDANFQIEVIEKSKTIPVLVDFWAEWCGPCRMLGPVLDKAEKHFNGKFILAKLDTDHNQKTAGSFKISGIPAVKLFRDGNVIDEFTGAMSEPNVLKFLEKHIADESILEVMEIAKSDVLRAAEIIFEKNLKGQMPEEILWKGIAFLIRNRGIKEKILSLTDAVPFAGSKFSDGRNAIIEFLKSEPVEEDMLQMSNALNQEKTREGMDYFLEKLSNAREPEKNRYKNALISCFFLIGTTEQIVNEYRKKMAAVLF